MENLLATLHGSTAPSFSEFEQLLSGSCSFLVLPWLLLSFLSLNTTVNRPQSRLTFHIQMHPGWLLSQSIASSLSLMSLLFQWSLFFFFFLCTCHLHDHVTSVALAPTHLLKKEKSFPIPLSLSPSYPSKPFHRKQSEYFYCQPHQPKKGNENESFSWCVHCLSRCIHSGSNHWQTANSIHTPHTF